MNEANGHFTSYFTGESPISEKVQKVYGCTYDGLCSKEKIFLISTISKNLTEFTRGEIRDEIYYLATIAIAGSSLDDQEAFLKSLTEQF